MRSSHLDTLIPLLDVDSAEWAGAKAFHLAHLARQGIPVPETFVLPAGSEEMPEGGVLEALGGCIAVRSSTTAEDSDSASFAGQFVSILNVRTRDELVRAIREVRASAGGEAVSAYCAARQIDRSEIRTAVVLQRMVRADVAGVLFTVDPVSGREDEMVIETCRGLADDLISGRTSGVRIPIRDGRPPSAPDPLSTSQVLQLAEMGRRIQRLKGCPQDIEWAVEDGCLYILQAHRSRACASAGSRASGRMPTSATVGLPATS